MFDCWLQEEEIANEGHQPEDIAACRDAIEAALARVQEAIAEPEPMARDYLKGKGITTGLSTSGKGETDPRVPTPDGVEEQENRRVEIRIN